MSITGGQLFDRSTEEFEISFGEQIRALRINSGLDQSALASLAGISLGAVKNLEQGKGSTLRTVIRAVRALDREDWLDGLAPRVSVSPLDVLRNRRAPRQRVFKQRSSGADAE
jgi:transcriptional regulator with XRE-family HTH domain